jgi:hypothetical protein
MNGGCPGSYISTGRANHKGSVWVGYRLGWGRGEGGYQGERGSVKGNGGVEGEGGGGLTFGQPRRRENGRGGKIWCPSVWGGERIGAHLFGRGRDLVPTCMGGGENWCPPVWVGEIIVAHLCG